MHPVGEGDCWGLSLQGVDCGIPRNIAKARPFVALYGRLNAALFDGCAGLGD